MRLSEGSLRIRGGNFTGTNPWITSSVNHGKKGMESI